MSRKAYFKHIIWGAGMSVFALSFSAQAFSNSYGANSYGANGYAANNGAFEHGYAPQGQAYGGGAYGGGDVYGHDAYQAGAFQGSAFQGSAFQGHAYQGGQSGCQGRAGFQGRHKTIKSRYGVWQESYQVSCQMGGYWIYPTQQYVAEPPIIQHRIVEETVAPIPAPAPIVVQPDCPEGQHLASNGQCAVWMTQAPEPYIPPQSYPAPSTPIPSYVLPRK